MTRLVNKHHKVPYDVYIGRGSKWGNPYSHLPSTLAQYKVATREDAIEKYRQWIMKQPELLGNLGELRDKILCCYCSPKICHGDVLIELIEALDK
jgi:hypothetical protein